jgi:hydrogenase expression/formation protein HypE
MGNISSVIKMGNVVTLAHGSGGVETAQILSRLFFNRLEESMKRTKDGVGIDFPDDAAAIRTSDGYFVVKVDSYTVKPLFFPGGDIGVLAASGSINDVLMLGGLPIAILDAIVTEEGFDMDILEKIINSFVNVLKQENIPLIGGDFKVMPKGQIDGIVISTVGVGFAKKLILDKDLKPGDRIITTGFLGDHGATILAMQQGINLSESSLKSDVRPLTRLMKPLLEKYSEYIHAARDPTRGGAAMVFNDWARESGTVIIINEKDLPIRSEVKTYCDMLGIDPLYLANEGAAIIGVDPNVADEIVEFMKRHGFDKAMIIGEVKKSEEFNGLVLLKTVVGGYRILEPPMGELVPRIC